MKIYKAILKQEGQGCDYTIECGTKVITLEAPSMPEAENTLKEIIKTEYIGDLSLKSAILIEVSDMSSIKI